MLELLVASGRTLIPSILGRTANVLAQEVTRPRVEQLQAGLQSGAQAQVSSCLGLFSSVLWGVLVCCGPRDRPPLWWQSQHQVYSSASVERRCMRLPFDCPLWLPAHTTLPPVAGPGMCVLCRSQGLGLVCHSDGVRHRWFPKAGAGAHPRRRANGHWAGRGIHAGQG